jgi:methionine-rich copper-binding protein CopC
MKRLTKYAIGALIAAAFTTQVFAHAHLQTAVPAQNGPATEAPKTLQLKFSEGLELSFTGLTLTGPAKAIIPTGVASLAAGDDTTLVVPVMQQLANGTYTVNWHALLKDGHKTHGTYTFTVKS